MFTGPSEFMYSRKYFFGGQNAKVLERNAARLSEKNPSIERNWKIYHWWNLKASHFQMSLFNGPWEMWQLFQDIIYKLNTQYISWFRHCIIALRWMTQTLTNEKSALVQVIILMAWCHQITSHYMSQCSPRSVVSLSHHDFHKMVGHHSNSIDWAKLIF